MTIDRRTLLLGLAACPAASGARAQSAANQWFAVTDDDGRPVPNTRAPVELVEEIEDLDGAIWAGPASAGVKLVEFYDYNCPFCRAAESARDRLRQSDRDLRIGLVNNPILSPASAAAARVDLAVLRLKGAAASYALHQRLFALPGRVDGARALDVAAALGLDRAEIERVAQGPEVAGTLRRQLALAASLGLSATPAYVVGGAAILGFPGEGTLGRIVADARRCGAIVCP